MYAQVGGNFRSRLNRFVGNDDIAGTVIQNTDDRTVVHRPTRQIPHTHIGSFAIKITTFQVRQCYTDLFYFADSGHLTDFIVYIFGDIDGDITSVTFGPSFLPQISGYFGYFIHLFGQFTKNAPPTVGSAGHRQYTSIFPENQELPAARCAP